MSLINLLVTAVVGAGPAVVFACPVGRFWHDVDLGCGGGIYNNKNIINI